MENPEPTTRHLAYRYEALESYFEVFATPVQAAAHLDLLLLCLVYFEYRERINAHYETYSAIYELKSVLQTMITEEDHGNS